MKPSLRSIIAIALVAVAVVMLFAEAPLLARAGMSLALLAAAAITQWQEYAARFASESLAVVGILLFLAGRDFYFLAGILTLPFVLKHVGRFWDRIQINVVKGAMK